MTVAQAVHIASPTAQLEGILEVPARAKGVVLFAHGSGSGRHSPRNQFVARSLQQAGFATLLVDLLQPAESENPEAVFDVPLLADRVLVAAQWLRAETETAGLPLGLFGGSTGAAAALSAAAQRPEMIGAAVSRGGRPDLAAAALPHVRCPTLLLVGQRDTAVLRLNEEALKHLRCPARLVVVPRASHLFTEPGTLEVVAKYAAEWFDEYLPGDQPPQPTRAEEGP